MKKLKSYNKDRKGTIISLLLLCFVLTLSVGYSVMNKELTISTEAAFRVEKDIRVTGISLKETTNSGVEEYKSNYSTDIIKVGVTLPNNNSSVTYRVKVTNYSNTPMRITNIAKTVINNNYAVTFNKTIPLTINKLSEEEIDITFSNNTNTSQTINSVLQFTFAKSEAIMTIGSIGSGTTTFYGGTLTKNSIEMVKFMPTKEIPNDAIGYWDVSYTAGANEVIAYYLDEDENGLYELYIAADGEVYAPVNSSNLFTSFINVTAIDFNDSFNTSKTTSMGYDILKGGMFGNCKSLKELDLSKFDTRNVTNMASMFGYWYNSNNLEKITFGDNFITTNVTDMSNMFFHCSKLKTIDLTSFNTSKVTIMSGMFYNCASLADLDLSSFNTSNVVYFYGGKNYSQGMFQNCTSLTSLNLANFNTEKAINMQQMFHACTKLKDLDISNFNTSNVTDMGSMFCWCGKLTSLDLSNFNTSNVTDMNSAANVSNNQKGMFRNCTSLKTLNLSSFDTTNITTMKWMFANCSSLTDLDIRNFDFTNVTDNTDMFSSVPASTNIIAKTDIERNYILGIRNDFTNIKTIAELPIT